jgi:hypothetical protein
MKISIHYDYTQHESLFADLQSFFKVSLEFQHLHVGRLIVLPVLCDDSAAQGMHKQTYQHHKEEEN